MAKFNVFLIQICYNRVSASIENSWIRPCKKSCGHIYIHHIYIQKFAKGLVGNYGEAGGGGGATKWEGGGGEAREVLPLRKWGVEKVLAMLKGGGRGHNKFWGSFYAVA